MDLSAVANAAGMIDGAAVKAQYDATLAAAPSNIGIDDCGAQLTTILHSQRRLLCLDLQHRAMQGALYVRLRALLLLQNRGSQSLLPHLKALGDNTGKTSVKEHEHFFEACQLFPLLPFVRFSNWTHVVECMRSGVLRDAIQRCL